MAGRTTVFDTNILIDFLNGIEGARAEFSRFADRAISAITRAEVMVGAPAERTAETRSFLTAFTFIDVDLTIAERAVAIRRARRIKLPDALIWATAETRRGVLATRNTRDLPEDEPGIRAPSRR